MPNWKLLSPEERARRKRARRRREHRRLNQKRNPKRTAKKRRQILDQLRWEGAIIHRCEPIGHAGPLFGNTREIRREVRRLNDEAAVCSGPWWVPGRNDQWLIEMPKVETIESPKASMRCPVILDVPLPGLVIQDADTAAKLLRFLGSWSPFDPAPGALNECPWHHHALTVTFRPGQDAVWECRKCCGPSTSLEFARRYSQFRDIRWAWGQATQFSLPSATGEEIGRACWPTVVDNVIGVGAKIYQGRVKEGDIKPAFGCWALIKPTQNIILPWMQPIKHRGYQRDEYLVNFRWNRWSFPARADVYTRDYRPLFRFDFCSSDEPTYQRPLWIAGTLSRKILYTTNRADASSAESAQVGIPRGEMTPVFLLDEGVSIDSFGYRDCGPSSGVRLAVPAVEYVLSPHLLHHPPGHPPRPEPRPTRVLFVDYDEPHLSRAAAAFLLNARGHFAASAASICGGLLDYKSVLVLDERCVIIDEEPRQRVEDLSATGETFDYVITLCERSGWLPLSEFGGAERIDWRTVPSWNVGSADPFEPRRMYYRSLCDKVQQWAASVRKEQPSPEAMSQSHATP